jgi:glycosyltransferase involved in cell wall biosynthesis
VVWARRRGAQPLLGIVVPAYDVAAYLPACLDSVLASSHGELDVVVVDDGSPDASGEIAEQYAARDPRVRVVHIDNRGLGAARNEGLRHVRGDYVGFADSDDVVPPGAYAALVGSLERSGADLATGSIVRWEGETLTEPPWMRRLHHPARTDLSILDHPELLGDVFAWNKVYRRSFWEDSDLRWPEGVRYEDQPTTTRAFLAADGIDLLADVVYHWRIRRDGTSITQQRGSLRDLDDRFATKRMSLHAVDAYVAGSGDPRASTLRQVFVDRVLAGDLHRYFAEIPGCDDTWWSLLRSGIAGLWGDRSLTHSGLTPAHRLIGWLVEQDRRDDAAAVATYVRDRGRPLDRVDGPGGVRIDVPVLDVSTVDPAALEVRPSEAGGTVAP